MDNSIIIIIRYKKHPALVPFGVGKRQCMGEALARNELMLFTVGLIQRLTFLPPDSGAMPDPEDYHVGVTRIPADFRIKIGTPEFTTVQKCVETER